MTRHLRHGGFGIGVEQLRPVLDDAAIFLRRCRAGSPARPRSVTMGMLKQSQKRTKRAALVAEAMSRHPASTIGWLATKPIGRALRCARSRSRMFLAKSGWISKKSASSTIFKIASLHVVGLVGVRRVSSVSSEVFGALGAVGLVGRTRHGRLVVLRQEIEESAGFAASASTSLSKARSATPDLLRMCAPPRPDLRP